MNPFQLGMQLTLLIGPMVPLPAPFTLMQSIASISVQTSDSGRSGFQLSFHAGRSTMLSMDYDLIITQMLRPFNRVVIIVTVNAIPYVLMDGIITTQELQPGNGPQGGLITVTGEDVSIMMDMHEKSMSYPAMNAEMIVGLLMVEYLQYGIIPEIIPPLEDEIDLPVERIPVQNTTDLKYIEYLASQYGYVFYVKPGPVPLTNTGYWGPPQRISLPQPALSVNMGGATNVNSISFTNNGLAPTLVTGMVYDLTLETVMPIDTLTSTRLPPLVTEPAIVFNMPNVRTQLLEPGGLDALLAFAHAQATTDYSTDQVVVAQGELDTVRYGNLLSARGLVGVRGVGYSYDGLYYVKSVSHQISQNSYTQSFVLTREGLGSITPVVVT